MMGMQNTSCCNSPDTTKQELQMSCHPGNPQECVQCMQYDQAGMSKDAAVKDKQHSRRPCTPQETSISCVMLATAYVPFQKFCGTWPPLKSLIAGTAFPELFSPYCKREYVNLEPEVKCGMHPAGGGCK
jgi:hypothetical protein